mgnify:CR=1 FL=1
MTVGNEHLEYQQRHYGMDHDRYEWSMLSTRKPVQWPGGKTLALWVNVGGLKMVVSPCILRRFNFDF